MENIEEKPNLKIRRLIEESRESRPNFEVSINEEVKVSKPISVIKNSKVEESKDSLRSLNVAGLVFEYHSKEQSQEIELKGTPKRRKGRPKKNKEEKTRNVSIQITPLYLKEIMDLKEFDGLGITRRFKRIYSAYNRMKEIEKKQLKILTDNLKLLNDLVKELVLIFTKQKVESGIPINDRIERKVSDIKNLMNVYQFDFKHLIKIFDVDLSKALAFVYDWDNIKEKAKVG